MEARMGTTILLVDDIQMFIDIEKEFLHYSQAEILTARNGQEALDVIKSMRPDLVFMDLQMPRMDGAACCRAVKSDPTLRGIPVVMVTTKGKEEDKEACFSAGCDCFLTKPLDRDQFLEVARKFVPNIDRREKRLAIGVNGTFRSDGAAMPCTLYDLSVGGAFVKSDYAGVPDRVIQISFTLPDGTVIESHGTIAWVNRTDTSMPRGFGVRFALLPRHAKKALASFVETAG
jgi:CheY-like chemotaxis protein